jgi:hypothetical protein
MCTLRVLREPVGRKWKQKLVWSRAWLEEGELRARKALGQKFMIASYELRITARTQMSGLQLVDSLHEFMRGLMTGRRFMIIANRIHTNQRVCCRKHVSEACCLKVWSAIRIRFYSVTLMN